MSALRLRLLLQVLHAQWGLKLPDFVFPSQLWTLPCVKAMFPANRWGARDHQKRSMAASFVSSRLGSWLSTIRRTATSALVARVTRPIGADIAGVRVPQTAVDAWLGGCRVS